MSTAQAFAAVDPEKPDTPETATRTRDPTQVGVRQLIATFGRCRVKTTIDNIDHTRVTGPHHWYTAAKQQLTNAGIAPLLDEIMTVEPVGAFKPAREVYEMAAATLGVTTNEIRMVAAHDWDIAGAMAAGCAGALLLRPGMVSNPLFPAPDIVESDFDRLTGRIIALEHA